MSIASLLARLQSVAIELSLDDGENLRIRGNKSALTPALLGQIKDNKAALIAHFGDLVYPTSFGQHRFWLIDKMLPGSTHYNLPLVFSVPLPFMVQVAQKAFECIIERHQVLRTVFVKDDTKVMQKVLPSIDFKLAIHNISDEASFAALVINNAQTQFDLAKGPLFKAAFVQLKRDGGVEEGALLVNLHHIIADQWSLDILTREFSVLYQAFAM
ncbi:MAG: condensation domain-containing protein, partial [Psychrosphaera sp.]|nr:condensation domain-containing protein [Psychrosphaera sp.]